MPIIAYLYNVFDLKRELSYMHDCKLNTTTTHNVLDRKTIHGDAEAEHLQ